MTTDIFIKTCRKDYEWLGYCLRSIQKYATGFRKVVVVDDSEDSVPPVGKSERIIKIKNHPKGYLYQQLIKLLADQYSDAEFITYMDSDTVFTKPVAPDDLIENFRKPIWPYTPYVVLNTPETDNWRRITSAAAGYEVEYEFMRRHPITIPRWALCAYRVWFLNHHKKLIDNYIMSVDGNNFSEFNSIGAFLWGEHHDKIAWQNTETNLGKVYVEQFWSHGGITPEIKAKLDKVLE